MIQFFNIIEFAIAFASWGLPPGGSWATGLDQAGPRGLSQAAGLPGGG